MARITHGNPLVVMGVQNGNTVFEELTRASAVPAPGSPTPAPTLHPTAEPTVQACAAIINSLGPNDEMCHADCDVTMPGTCTCAVHFTSIRGTCYHMCNQFGMTCAGRFSDAPGSNACAYFDVGTHASEGEELR